MADAPHPGWDDRMTRWVDQWGSRMVQFAATYTGDVDAAQNVAQEAIIRLYQWHRAHPEADLNPAWLYTVTSNLARDYLRRRARRRAEPLNADRLSEASDDWVVRIAVREAWIVSRFSTGMSLALLLRALVGGRDCPPTVDDPRIGAHPSLPGPRPVCPGMGGSP